MGLLKGIGRGLKGLFADGDLADTLAEAHAYLDGDYGRALELARRSQRPRLDDRDGARNGRDPLSLEPAGTGPHKGLHIPIDGTIIEHPLTGDRLMLDQGAWRRWFQ
jgi:hypothetical protein